ncbi:Bax inhibitor-1/YccA family protein [Phragmitibacter flavus]|uniref:Bax inhibitor-1/YccA family protein n=1 Tax=Phragmitibacter flavus TaxID=2576071 RepID=A0A5R8KLM4_9BACT|nr:Bax inhibitor-1/YccA family protein [Phragmitibacter flavus]
MRTSNPTMSESTFIDVAPHGGAVMTLQGTVNKTLIFLGLLCTTAMWSWNRFWSDPSSAMPFILGGAIAGLVLALITAWKKQWAPITGSLYAVAEGLFVGALSALYASQYEGIVPQAILLTVGVLLALLAAYTTRLIKPSQNFKMGIAAATGGIALVYIATLVLGMFGIQVPFIHGNGLFGIGFSLFVVIIAALNLVLDFDFIENGVSAGAPKYLEWYAAFGLLVTLVWLYVEILRLLAKLAGRKE